jgi:DNA polymerase-3 subunit alpha
MIDLHVHTKYSLLDAISEPEELIKKISNLGRKGICVTEHGNFYSSIEVYKLCQLYNVKYLHGCEVYICNDVNERSKNSKYNHLILISMNETGRQNLCNLVSRSTNFKYYGKPRIDFNMLQKYKEGLIAISACMAGEIQRALMNNDIELAKDIALKYKNEFNDNYYLEYQSHSEPTQQKLNRMIVDLANELDIKYVVTTDSHYINKEDQKYHSVFVQIGQAREAGETYNDCYIQTEEEMLEICKSTIREENLKAIIQPMKY